MRLYKLVEQILAKDEQARNDDAVLQLQVWEKIGVVKYQYYFDSERNVAIKKKNPTLMVDMLHKGVGKDSIRRTRQKLAEKFPDKYGPTDPKVIEARNKVKNQKGTHIYREEVAVVKAALF